MAAALLAVACIALGIARHAAVWSDPWDRSVASVNGAWYASQPARNWERLGFWTTKGLPYLAALPTSPPTGALYAHHPPMFPWAIYACVSRLGWSERSFRLLPSIAAALTGGLIVILAARWCGLATAAIAGLVWLVLPISFLYGSMCSPESWTLLLMLGTFILHDRLRNARIGWYGVVAACHFVSAQIDWQGNFMVPTLFLFELLQPKGTRRIGRVVMLGVTSIVSTGAVMVAHGFFLTVCVQGCAMALSGAGGPAPAWELSHITDYVAAGVRNMLDMAHGSIHADAGIEVGDWFAAQGRNAVAMFTWPGALATAAGVAWFARSRRRTLLPGVVLLVPGVLNIVVFRRYWDHEFWAYHAAAGVAITTAELCRLLPWKFVGVAIVAAVVGFGAYGVHERLESWKTNDYRDGARELDALVENPDDILVCDGRASLLTFYMRHWVVAKSTTEALNDVYAIKKAGRITNSLVVLVAAFANSSWVPSEVDSALGRFGTVRRISADEVAARMPAFKRLVSPGPLWLVRLSR